MMFKSAVIVCLFGGMVFGLSIDDCPKDLPRDKTLFFSDTTCYRIADKKRMSFWHAEIDCENEGGTLVVIKSESVNTLILSKVQDILGFGHFGVWIGLYDENEEGSFMWKDGTFLSSEDYNNWESEEGQKLEPGNHVALYDEDCVQLSLSSGKWHDRECRYWFDQKPTLAPYVCQYNLIHEPYTLTPSAATSKKTETTTTTPVPITNASTSRMPTSHVPSTQLPTFNVPSTVLPTTHESTIVVLSSAVPETSTTTAEQTTLKTSQTTPLLPTCPPFVCRLDCGMEGYTIDKLGCSVCECDV